MVMHDTYARSSSGGIIGRGAMAGVVAGLVFAAFEMIVSAVLMGASAFFMPLRMIGAIALGPAALGPDYSLLAVGFTGVAVHMALAVLYGIIFAALVSFRTPTRTSTVLFGTLYGFLLWLINFYIIAPNAFPWFLESNPVVQFVAHTFFFGTVLGLMMTRRPATET